LAIETSTPVSGVALAKDNRLLAEINVQTGNTHSERLMPQIEKLFALGGVTPQEVEAIAVSIGPGSFTGLRIGLTTAKALAYAWGKAIVGVPTLEALAYGCPAGVGWVAAMLDAQKGRVYQALYQWRSGVLAEIAPVRIVDAKQALQEMAELPEPVMIVGESAREYAEMAASFGEKIFLAPEQAIMPRSASVAFLGLLKMRAGLAVAAVDLTPLYVRRPEAEELWEKRCGANS
jgi:tRNA threonylcarbamoyladenosine biosynthesis protein TsaB